jgi:predicted small lipoprotein YifL
VPLSSRVRFALVAAALVALAGCGRRGDLEPPQAAAAKPENRHSVELHRSDRKITPPKKDFALDPLLQ